MNPDPSSFGDLPPQSLGHDAGYRNIIDVQFISRALDRRARCVRGASWPTAALYPRDAPEVIASAYYEYSRSFEALARVDDALAHVIRQGDTVTVRLASDSYDALERAERHLRQQLPEPQTDRAHQVAVDFCALTDRGLRLTTRTLTVPTLAEIEANYPSAVRRSLAQLSKTRLGEGGRLLLWHGLPGCGKTWALRALASEWQDRCKLRYVSDPERLFEDSSYLIDIIHMRPGGRGQDDRWWLIVLEDTGEGAARGRRQAPDRSGALASAECRRWASRRELPGALSADHQRRSAHDPSSGRSSRPLCSPGRVRSIPA